jgi:hypothetical protein
MLWTMTIESLGCQGWLAQPQQYNGEVHTPFGAELAPLFRKIV